MDAASHIISTRWDYLIKHSSPPLSLANISLWVNDGSAVCYQRESCFFLDPHSNLPLCEQLSKCAASVITDSSGSCKEAASSTGRFFAGWLSVFTKCLFVTVNVSMSFYGNSMEAALTIWAMCWGVDVTWCQIGGKKLLIVTKRSNSD